MCWKVGFQFLTRYFALLGQITLNFILCCGQLVFKIQKIHFLCAFVSIFATIYRFNILNVLLLSATLIEKLQLLFTFAHQNVSSIAINQ